MLRNIWLYLWFIPSTIFFSLVAILGRFDSSGRIGFLSGHTWSKLMLWAAGVTVHADLSAHPPDMPLIIVANHQSMLDILVLYSLFPSRTIGFVAKDSLFKVPIFGPAMYAAGHVPIDRKNPRKAMKSIDHAIFQAGRGRTIVIFPEGTRSRDLSTLHDFQIGGMVLALKCQLPVMPVLITGTADILPKGALSVKTGRPPVRVLALPPFNPCETYALKDREQFKLDLFHMMNARYQEMRNA